MRHTKTEQFLWLLLAWLFTAGVIFFVADSAVAASLAFTFTGVVGVFLGIDLAVMIKKTSALPNGQYKEINRPRYLTSLALFSLLLAETIYISAVYSRNCDALYASFGMGFLIVIGGLMSGIEANKIVTCGHGGGNAGVTEKTL